MLSSAQTPLTAGIELGGTKCIATLATGPDQIVDQQRVPTTSPDETFAALRAIISGWQAKHRIEAAGIAAFGPLDLDPASQQFGHVLETSKPGWSGTDILDLFEKDAIPLAIDTDVNAAALAEMRWGAAKGLADLAYVTVGTGIGVGLVVNGTTPKGFGHCEMGHVRIPNCGPDAAHSVCPFHDDCAEGLASGPAIVSQLDGQPVADVAPDAPIWDAVARRLGALCHILCCSTTPRAILFGGGVIMRQPHLIDRIRAATAGSINGYIALPPMDELIGLAGLGFQAGPSGAIALGIQAHADAFA